MPLLNWVGKEEVINHHRKIPFRLLKPVKELTKNEDSENLLVEGDNLEALKALMPYYHNSIKCIYIDPPYNTGNENWRYNDNVNSPKIQKWLNKVVNRDDLCKHDKWLCMMYPRIKLLHELLKNDGVMFISINDNELTNLTYLLNDIFGEQNIEVMIWYKIPEEGTAGQGKMKITHRFRLDHEYVVVCYKDKANTKLNKPLRLKKFKNDYGNADNDPRGDWMSCEICKSEIKSNSEGKNYYSVKLPSGREVTRQWHMSYEDFKELDEDKRIYWGSGKSIPRLKNFLEEPSPTTPTSVIFNISQTEGNNELKELLGENKFDNPKPLKLIKWLLEISSNKNDLILDSFAGSGTTGQAVLELNKENKGNRKFILIELEKDIARNVTHKRISKVISKMAKIDKISNGFQYFTLSDPLFENETKLSEDCTYEELATYIYFTETESRLDNKVFSKPFIGAKEGRSYYLIYNKKEKTILNKTFLNKLKDDNKKIIYADKCLIDEESLEMKGIIFKQIPYEIKIY